MVNFMMGIIRLDVMRCGMIGKVGMWWNTIVITKSYGQIELNLYLVHTTYST
jgi:hypothetical protein